MKKIKDIEQRAWGKEHRAKSTGHRAKSANCAVRGFPMTNDQCPMTSDFKLVIKKPQQFYLHGSRYKSNSCLPREGFNSGVCPGAAAITKKRSAFSSLRATLSSENFHLKYITRFEKKSSLLRCCHSEFISESHRTRKEHFRNLIREGLPM